jgi:hypothetical protein
LYCNDIPYCIILYCNDIPYNVSAVMNNLHTILIILKQSGGGG